MTPPRLLPLAPLLLALVLAGCSGLIGRGDWDPFRSGSGARVSIEVNNQNASHVRVRAVAPGNRFNLGTVEGLGRSTFSIPWSRLEDLRFQVELLAGRSHTTPSVRVSPGDRVELWIQDPIQRSVVRR